MPRRKFRLTMPRNRPTTRHHFNTTGLTMSDSEWESMVSYQSFATESADDLEDYEYWVAKIRDIKGHKDQEVWTRVQWFYSAEDVTGILKLFKPDFCGKYERIISDHYGFVHVDCFSGTTSMSHFREDDLQQRIINHEEFFYRYQLDCAHKLLKPKQTYLSCGLCKIPYSPEDSDPHQLMHICPRPSCKKAFHVRCLQDHTPSLRDLEKNHMKRTLRLISTWPHTDELLTISMLASPVSPTRGKKGKVEPRSEQAAEITQNFLDSLPSDLIKVAEQPIVRGGAFPAGGISGNVAAVVAARKLIYDALQGSSVPDDWDKDLNMRKVVVSFNYGGKRRSLQHFLCPSCSSPI
ncbi:hypothetical protein AMATHDRAFT_75332 [Amanita thiersii Skay4041]|uniref:BAH domain-containing protein n=1 Tax=Amanita thiersii Skay4041 TaxID=703135 RepID=A0A2A9NT79_9AGAR|nr:hypothetical protein AMATHDRAFT_75332 [Amanita thiersii Skay4041]